MKKEEFWKRATAMDRGGDKSSVSVSKDLRVRLRALADEESTYMDVVVGVALEDFLEKWDA